MSEPISISLTIGGNLKKSCLEDFFNALKDDLDNVVGYTSIEEILSETDTKTGLVVCNSWNATANWGACDTIKALLEQYKLSYKHNCEASNDYGATIEYWFPSMKQPVEYNCNHQGLLTLKTEEIRPYIELLLSIAKDGLDEGLKILPTMMHNEHMRADLILKAKNPYKAIVKEVYKILPPPLPKIPGLFIT